jgi:ATP-dependent 26S proteasome regulatory subunit
MQRYARRVANESALFATTTQGRAQIFKIHTKSMSVERDIRFELLARLCPNSTGADLRSVCTEAGMFAVRQRRKVCSTIKLFPPAPPASLPFRTLR